MPKKITASSVKSAKRTTVPLTRDSVASVPDPQAEPHYRVKCTMLGPFPEGRIVSRSQFESIAGLDIARLLNLEPPAIEVVSDPVTEAPLPPGPENGTLSSASPVMGQPTMEGTVSGETSGAETEPSIPSEPDYDSMKVLELTRLAEERGIENYQEMSREELVAAHTAWVPPTVD